MGTDEYEITEIQNEKINGRYGCFYQCVQPPQNNRQNAFSNMEPCNSGVRYGFTSNTTKGDMSFNLSWARGENIVWYTRIWITSGRTTCRLAASCGGWPFIYITANSWTSRHASIMKSLQMQSEYGWYRCWPWCLGGLVQSSMLFTLYPESMCSMEVNLSRACWTSANIVTEEDVREVEREELVLAPREVLPKPPHPRFRERV